MVNSIGVFDNTYYFKGQEYESYNINSLLEKLGSKRRLLILSQSIFLKKYDISNKRLNLDKFIEKKIEEDFSDRRNLLFHYEFIKKYKVIYIYSIRCDKLFNLYTSANYLQVEPIQFLIKRYVIKKIREGKNSIIIYKIRDLFHLMNIEKGAIENSYITSNSKDVNKFILEYKSKSKRLIIDKDIKDTIEDNYDYIMNIGEKIHDEIYKK